MADGEIKIDTQIDTSGVDSGLNKLKTKLNNLGTETEREANQEKKLNKELDKTAAAEKKVNNELDKAKKNKKETTDKTKGLGLVLNEASGAAGGFANKMMSAAGTSGPLVAGAVAAVAALKKLGEAMVECTEIYNVQANAEKALEAAAKNNPYLSERSVQNLKNYASELQAATNYGDEGTIQLMAQLAATGRTEQEIIKIIGAAADYAAAKQMDLKSAVDALNATFTGTAGAMGRQIDEIKGLSDEELKHGKAIDVIAEKYKGLASTMSDTISQTKNATGDLKESIGRAFKATIDNIATWWQNRINDIKGWIDSITDYFTEASKTWVIGGMYNQSKDFVNQIDSALNQIPKDDQEWRNYYLSEVIDDLDSSYLDQFQTYLNLQKSLNENQQELLDYINEEIRLRQVRANNEVKYAAYLEKYSDYSYQELKNRYDITQVVLADEQERKALLYLMKQINEQENEELETAEEIYQVKKKTADEYAIDSNKALARDLQRMELEAQQTGKAVDAQQKYNLILKSYIALLTDTEGTIQESYPVVQKRLEQLQQAKQELDAVTDAEKKLDAAIKATDAVLQSLQDMQVNPAPKNALQTEIDYYRQLREEIQKLDEETIELGQKDNDVIYSKAELLAQLEAAEKEQEQNSLDNILAADKTYYDEYQAKLNDLLELKKAVDDSEVLSEEEKAKRMQQIDEKYRRTKAAMWSEIVAQIRESTEQIKDIADEAANLMLQNSKTVAELEMANLENQYSKGEMTETEYYDKMLEIKRKAAREEYKIQMFQWSASLLTATANIAEGVSKAIAQGYPIGLINGALVGAAGAVQLASIIASKPIPPAFANGGIIGGAHGASMGGDNTYIHARSGEMVLNAHQQRGLWDMISGQNGLQQGGFNLTVNNTQAGRVDTNVREQNGDVYIDILDKHINKGFTDGTYDVGMAAMNTRQGGGVRIL